MIKAILYSEEKCLCPWHIKYGYWGKVTNSFGIGFSALILLLTVHTHAQSKADLANAERFYDGNNWDKAAGIYTKITRENPFNGDYWYRLGLVEKHLGDHVKSNTSLTKAIECGSHVAESHYNIATNYSLLGDGANAVMNLKLAIRHGLNNREERLLTDSDLNHLRDLRLFDALLVPDTANALTRTGRWMEDIQFLKSQVEMTHYRLHDYYPKSKWDGDFEMLMAKITQLEDHELIVGLMQIMHQIGIGHSYLMPPFSGANHFHQIPIELYEFSDGIFVKQTLPAYRVLLGHKITSINGIPIERILEKASTLSIAENKIMKRRSSLFYATLPEILMAFEFATNVNRSIVGYLDASGNEATVTVTHQLFSPDSFLTRRTIKGWVSMDEAFDPPLFLSRLDEKFWYSYLADSQIVYCQINEIGNDKEQTLKEFVEDMLGFVNRNKVKALVLDLRFNLGGSGKLNKDLVSALIKCEKINQPGKLYTIIGNMTFSAAILLSTQLDQYTETIFIGEPSGGRPSHVGDDNEISLPHSGLKAYASKSFWQSPVPYDERNWIAPEFYIKPSSIQWKQGFDPCLDLIIRMKN